MVNIEEMIKKTYDREFLKADHIVEGESNRFIFTNEGEEHESNYKGSISKKLKIQGDMNGDKYHFDMGVQLVRAISSVLGEDTSKWVGSVADLETVDKQIPDEELGTKWVKVIAIKQDKETNEFSITPSHDNTQ